MYACVVVKCTCCLQAVLVHRVDCVPVRFESVLHLREELYRIEIVQATLQLT